VHQIIRPAQKSFQSTYHESICPFFSNPYYPPLPPCQPFHFSLAIRRASASAVSTFSSQIARAASAPDAFNHFGMPRRQTSRSRNAATCNSIRGIQPASMRAALFHRSLARRQQEPSTSGSLLKVQTLQLRQSRATSLDATALDLGERILDGHAHAVVQVCAKIEPSTNSTWE